MRITVRPERSGDEDVIRTALRDAFDGEVEGAIVDAVRQDSSSFVPELSMVAEVDGALVGHVLLSRLTLEGEADARLLALGPIGVRKGWQRQGVGAALMRAAISAAASLGYRGIVLIGHPTYYPRFGFEPASRFGLKVPYDVPDDVAMALPLLQDGLKGLSGRVLYPTAFDLASG